MISYLHTYENPEGEILELPEIWAEFPISLMHESTKMHARDIVNGRRAAHGHKWVKSYFMSPPDDTWKEVGTRNG